MGHQRSVQLAQTRRAKEREIARLREQLKNDGELVRHSIFDRTQVVKVVNSLVIGKLI